MRRCWQSVQIISLWLVEALGILCLGGVVRHYRGTPVTSLVVPDGILWLLTVTVNRLWLRTRIGLRSVLPLNHQFRVNAFPLVIVVFLLSELYDYHVTHGMTFMTAPLTGLGGAFVVAVYEETLFRGILLAKCLYRLRASEPFEVMLAVGQSSLLYGVMHLLNLVGQPLSTTLLQVVTSLAAGALFAAVYLRTRCLLWPIFLHMIVDFVSFLLRGIAPVPPTMSIVMVSVLTATVALIVAGFLLRRPEETLTWQTWNCRKNQTV